MSSMVQTGRSLETLRRTPLYETHISLGAKMAPFGGFDMPVQYDSIINEHFAARQSATIFDTCHMGEFLFNGPTAVQDLERLLTCPVATMEIGQCRYGFLCNETGGVIDDQVLYRLGEHEFFMVVNASTQETDFDWIGSHLSDNTEGKNLSENTGKIDLQGPASPKIMRKLMDEPVDGMKYYRFMHNTYRKTRVLTSRTGYTGEIGFEIYCEPDLAVSFFLDCLSCGATPAGLGARDTLRLEMGMPLYGHELDADRNPAETGFSRAIDAGKAFIGSEIVLDPARTSQSLVGILLEGRRAARSGDAVTDGTGSEKIGTVTSGSYSPCLQKAIALAYISKKLAHPDNPVAFSIGRQQVQGTIVELPFYHHATGRKAISNFL